MMNNQPQVRKPLKWRKIGKWLYILYRVVQFFMGLADDYKINYRIFYAPKLRACI
jgi:hypothetical protein